MDRELLSNYSMNSSHSRISHISGVNNFIGDSNIYNQANLIEMLHNIRQDHTNISEEGTMENNDNIINQSDSVDTISSNELFEQSILNKNDSSSVEDPFFEVPDYILIHHGRAATAPTRPVNELEEFKYSSQFIHLEKAVFYLNKLVMLKPESKFDVDSEEGSEICKRFLEQVEKLIKSLKVETSSREYRKTFSKAYRYLYQDESLCYLTEILDSAQEGIPCLWVNGEKYSFSSEVLECGSQLYTAFNSVMEMLKFCYNILRDETFLENVKHIKTDLKKGLQDFDLKWVNYEQKYISELIFIENESRRFITTAIEIEKDLTYFEVRAKCRGKFLLDSPEYNSLRTKLVDLIVQINKVANTMGKGRDDLTLSILISAEGVLRKVTEGKSKSVRHLAENIKNSFVAVRKLLLKYENNIEIVDPQLKNNPDLVDCLYAFETSWEKGKEYLLNIEKYSQLLFFSEMIEVLCEKYKEISEQIDSRDPNIFVWIPSILILRSLDSEDKGICREFMPNMNNTDDDCGRLYLYLQNFKETLYENLKDHYFAYNLLEKLVLFEEDEVIGRYVTRSNISEFKKNLKTLSMNLQRLKPVDWNNFFDLAMLI